MTPRYLYPVRKRIELLAALYAGGFGLFVWATSFHGEPLAWAGMDNRAALAFGQAMSLAALVHALGIRINGHWRFSPVLRLVGMTAHACLLAWLAANGHMQTAGYTYGCATLLAIAGAWSAARDTARAFGGHEWVKN